MIHSAHAIGRQRGTTTVEFAIIAVVVILILLAIVEFGRAGFVVNAMSEGTRRAARLAAVCPVNDPAIAQAAVFGGGQIMSGVTTANVDLDYLNGTGGVIADPVGSFTAIRYVRVAFNNVQYRLLIPFVPTGVTMPSFSSTLPRESLGVPRQGVVQAC